MPLLLTLPLACARTDYSAADLQLDVDAPLPDGAETIHVCVEGHGELSEGAGNGRVAFTGLPAGEPAVVSLDVLDADGGLLASAGPTALDAETPWASTPLLDPGAPCEDPGARAPAGSDTWLLALRFAE